MGASESTNTTTVTTTPDWRYGYTPVALSETRLEYLEQECNIKSGAKPSEVTEKRAARKAARCVDWNPISVAIACETPELEDKFRTACQTLKSLYPDETALRAKLFDNSDEANIETPFSIINDMAPFGMQHLVKSHEVFFQLAETLAQNHPTILNDRNLNVVYPGSGAHLSPLLTATELIDLGAIDSADFVYTELNPNTARDVYTGLQAVQRFMPGYFDNLSIRDQTVSFTHSGKPVTVTAHINVDTEVGLKEGNSFSSRIKQYMPDRYFKSADMIVLHDIYVYPRDALLDLSDHQMETDDGKNRVVVSSMMAYGIPTVKTSKIKGPYGCSSDGEVGRAEDVSSVYIVELP